MTPKQERFVAEYLVDLNATQAALRSGYSPRTAADIGRQLLRKTTVAEQIARKRQVIARRNDITIDQIVGELALIGFANMADYMRVGPDGDPVLDFSKLTREQAAALTEVTVEDFVDGRGEDARQVRRVKFKLADKRAALVDLLKHVGGARSDDDPASQGDVKRQVTEQLAEIFSAAAQKARITGPVIDVEAGEAGDAPR